jgi:hypothetical protein
MAIPIAGRRASFMPKKKKLELLYWVEKFTRGY